MLAFKLSFALALTVVAFSARSGDISEARLKADVEKLAGFGERDACRFGPKSGIDAARRWIESHYSRSPGWSVKTHEFDMEDCPTDGTQRNVIATLEGSDLKDEAVLVTGHYDSIAWRGEWNQSPRSDRAPGANDSGSQTAALLELSRALAGAKPRRTLVLVSFAGEEEGLLGSKALVQDLATALPGKRVVAVVNLDIVGGDLTANGPDAKSCRLFAPDRPPHSQLARRAIDIAAKATPGFEVVWVRAVDRPGRSGDQISFQKAGIPAIRLIEPRETLAHQHSVQDLPEFVSPVFMARMVGLVRSVALELANN